MTRTSSITLCTILSIAILASCGTNKKLKSANATIDNLQQENANLTKNVNDLKRQVSDLSSQNTSMASQFNSYKQECEAKDQQLKQVSATLNEFNDNMSQLEEKIKTAEGDFASKGLDVYSKDGVIYVDMQDNLLYKSGSAKLSDDGKKALGNLASVLNEYPKLKVIVVGNTDTVHVRGIADNWSLSTERANGVVRMLSKDYSVDPGRLTAAGKGKFNPIADNSTEEGRAKNRRTEIVLNPDWERLWETVKKE